MATTIEKYVEQCNAVYEAKPKYVKNKSNLQECDCIGMDKYSFRHNNVSFSSTGTNYSYRKQVENCRAITSASDLHVGDVCFKAYEQDEPGWSLDKYPKYLPGGSEYNGDLRDYYHIGTVKSVNPLQIIHMTSPTAQCDTTLKGKGWDFVANWKKEYISDSPEPTPPEPPVPPTPEPEMATVWSENGKPVNTRKGPDESYPQSKAGKIPVGEIVQVDETTVNSQGETWCKCEWTDSKGAHWKNFWIKKDFLIMDEPVPPVENPYTVHIPNLTQAQAQSLTAQYPGSWITEDGAVG